MGHLAYGAQDIPEMMRRVVEMERLYLADGRDKADHPMHGLFTGLVCPPPAESPEAAVAAAPKQDG